MSNKKISQTEVSLLSEKKKKFDESATKKQCISDLRALQYQFKDRYISRTLYRIHGKYSDGTWDQFFGTFHEFRRQSGLELNRHQQQLEKHIAKHASYDHYVEFFKSEVLPYHEKYQKKSPKNKRIKTGLVASDLHDLECDEFALSIFIDQCKRLQPDYIILNGDVFDLYEFSRFSIDPRKIKIKERYDFVHNRIFGPLREFCPNAQIDFIMGNHEFRLLRLLADQTPNLRIWLSDLMGIGFAELFGLDAYDINWVSKVDFGAYTTHDIKNQIRQNYKVYHDCYVVTHEKDWGFGLSGTNGHHHKIHMSSDANIPHNQITWVQTPGMHKLDAEYHGGLNNWNLGFNIFHIDTLNKSVIQNPVHVHNDWALVNGIYYKR